MKNTSLLPDYLDVLFLNRNQKYGSYELRRNYGKRIKKALAVTIVFVALGITYPVVASRLQPEHEASETATIRDVNLKALDDIPKKEEPKSVEIPSGPKVKTIKNVAIIVVPPDKITDKDLPPSKDLLDHAQTGTITTEGMDSPNDLSIIPGDGTDHTRKQVLVDPPENKIMEPYEIEQMPEFSGNIKKYLSEHLQYPSAARQQGIEGRVTVRFIVDEKGNVQDVQVRKGIGGGCDEEATRVVQAMPKWKPGKLNGKPVKTYFTLPITFLIE